MVAFGRRLHHTPYYTPVIDSQHIKSEILVTEIVYSVFVLTEAGTFQNGGRGGWDRGVGGYTFKR